jgi:hypothetical protein
MEYTLFKNRSYRGVISAGFGLYFTHFRLFFKASWIMALLYAAVFAALGTLCVIKLPAISAEIMKQTVVQHQELSVATAQEYLLLGGAIIILTLLYIIVEACTFATVLNKLKEHQDTDTMTVPAKWFSICRKLMGRTLKGYIFSLLVILVPVLVLIGLIITLLKFVALAPVTLTTTSLILAIAIILLAFPLVYVAMKYILNKGQAYFSVLSKSYGTGLRHWGHIFTTCLVAGMIISILVGLFCLPIIILTQAHVLAQEGYLNGDPLGMPDYVNLLTIVTFFITGFILVYLYMPLLLVYYYMYGSIEAYEKEKANIKNEI